MDRSPDQMRAFVEGVERVAIAHLDRDGAHALIAVTLERALDPRLRKVDRGTGLSCCNADQHPLGRVIPLVQRTSGPTSARSTTPQALGHRYLAATDAEPGVRGRVAPCRWMRLLGIVVGPLGYCNPEE